MHGDVQTGKIFILGVSHKIKKIDSLQRILFLPDILCTPKATLRSAPVGLYMPKSTGESEAARTPNFIVLYMKELLAFSST
jgi:hypothetical protein